MIISVAWTIPCKIQCLHFPILCGMMWSAISLCEGSVNMKIIKEFKEFISRGNVIDMAVGVIIGGAFTGIVNSLVNDIFMPVLGLLTGGMSFASLAIQIGPREEDVLRYGAFIAAAVNFLLIALVLFSLIKAMNKLHNKEGGDPRGPCSHCKSLPFLPVRDCC